MRGSAFTVLLILSCSAIAKEQLYRPPRLDTGQPDMQGMWIVSNSTPLQRPPGFTTLVIDEAQAAKLLAQLEARAEDRDTPTEPTEYFEAFALEPIRGQLRSSIVVDPTQRPDSRQRSLSAADRSRRWRACSRQWTARSSVLQPSAASDRRRCNRPFSRYATASTCTRSCRRQTRSCSCRSSSARPASFASARSGAPAAITSWLGDSIGRWDGDVLVVETRGFTPSDHVRFGGPSSSFLVSPRTIVTERFARVAEDRIDYSFTVDDPTYYTQPWQGESHFLRRDEPMLEYACHEANYSLVHILEGARERDRQEVR